MKKLVALAAVCSLFPQFKAPATTTTAAPTSTEPSQANATQKEEKPLPHRYSVFNTLPRTDDKLQQMFQKGEEEAYEYVRFYLLGNEHVGVAPVEALSIILNILIADHMAWIGWFSDLAVRKKDRRSLEALEKHIENEEQKYEYPDEREEARVEAERLRISTMEALREAERKEAIALALRDAKRAARRKAEAEKKAAERK